MKKIESHTNKCYLAIKNGKTYFYQLKTHNGFNHFLDYKLLKDFDFVPQLIFNNEKESYWEYIDGESKSILSDYDIKNLVLILKQIHNFKISAPKFNLDKRIAEYEHLCRHKNRNVTEITIWKKTIKKILNSLEKKTFLHGDIWEKNVLFKDNKIYLIDWEYSGLGDIHFELAYIILSFRFTLKQEKDFLDLYKTYDEKKLVKAKALVCYYTIVWINAQDQIFFDDKEFKEKLIEFKFLLEL